MFRDNNLYIRLLYDTLRGGPPRAFECLLCDKLYKRETGILSHLRKKHEVEVQACLYSTDKPTNENGEPRKLRAGAPNLNPISEQPSTPKKCSTIPDTEQEAEANQKQPQPGDSETSASELPLCMSPENCGFQMSPGSSCSADAMSSSIPTSPTGTNLESSNFWREPCRLCGAPRNKCCCWSGWISRFSFLHEEEE